MDLQKTRLESCSRDAALIFKAAVDGTNLNGLRELAGKLSHARQSNHADVPDEELYQLIDNPDFMQKCAELAAGPILNPDMHEAQKSGGVLKRVAEYANRAITPEKLKTYTDPKAVECLFRSDTNFPRL